MCVCKYWRIFQFFRSKFEKKVWNLGQFQCFYESKTRGINEKIFQIGLNCNYAKSVLITFNRFLTKFPSFQHVLLFSTGSDYKQLLRVNLTICRTGSWVDQLAWSGFDNIAIRPPVGRNLMTDYEHARLIQVLNRT